MRRRIGVSAAVALLTLGALGAPSVAVADIARTGAHHGWVAKSCFARHGHWHHHRWHQHRWHHRHWFGAACCNRGLRARHFGADACGPPPVVPEAPLVALVPLTGATLVIGFVIVRRRRESRALSRRVPVGAR